MIILIRLTLTIPRLILLKKRDIELSIEELRSTNIERHIGDTDILPYKFHSHKEPAIGGCDDE